MAANKHANTKPGIARNIAVTTQCATIAKYRIVTDGCMDVQDDEIPQYLHFMKRPSRK
jgi:hypothetical protein